jgi:uncharacterized protein with FMN-binding domain
MVSPAMPPPRFDRGTRRIALCGLTTLSALVLLFSYRTSTSPVLPDEAAGAPEEASPAVLPATAAPAAAPAVAPGPSVGKAATAPAWSGTVTGPVVPIKWGEVQVRATITQGRIVAVDVLRSPDENAHDRQLNAAAVPVLVGETLTAQSARIDMVSGATYTSTGYVQSLQAALDRTGTA